MMIRNVVKKGSIFGARSFSPPWLTPRVLATYIHRHIMCVMGSEKRDHWNFKFELLASGQRTLTYLQNGT